ncbi:hypothetical protein [Priestia koreensis]|uniref:hypothetical protein n=1 Tax=Priestia koreensis TaxID=284581 RepID=UPI00203F510B|nr:hypothetical protein [Priestia koreensis]MCM3005800.1 hypothetical protein [Priestia koreensis]
MKSYRVTKYKPSLRDHNGNYTDVEDWTSFSDIGENIHGELFTYDKYVITENKYIETIFYCMKDLNIESLIIKDLEIYQDEDELKNLTDNSVIDENHLESVIKLILREKIWAKLETDDLKIHFGYDYYMYIITKTTNSELLGEISSLGLYAEEFESPYDE